MEFYLLLVFGELAIEKGNFFSGVTICKYWPAKNSKFFPSSKDKIIFLVSPWYL